jgi:glycosyltransferase involved in cell wall biosynthesis
MNNSILSESLLTIGMPVFNGENTISKSIDSLLKQTFDDFKLIISDNASTDSTQKICEDYAKKDSRIRYIKQKKNIGLVPNWNFILNNSTTKYFMYAAADDTWDPQFVKKNLDVLESDENIVGSIGKVTFDLDFKNKQNIENHSIHRDLVLNMSGTYEDRVKSCLKLNQATAMYAIYRTASFQKCILFNDDPGYDLEILIMTLEFGNLNVINEFLMNRSSQGNSSKSLVLNALNNKSRIYKIIFPYSSVTLLCLKKLGITFFLKNLFLFLRLNANGSYLTTLDFLKLIKKNQGALRSALLHPNLASRETFVVR